MNEEKSQSRAEVTAGKYNKPTPWEIIVASVAGLGSGVIAAAAAVRKEFGEEAKHWPGMADTRVDNGKGDVIEGGEGLISNHEIALFKCDEKYRGEPESWREHAAETRKLKTKFYHDRANLFEKEYGIASKGIGGLIEGTYQRLWRIGGGTRREIAYKGAYVAVLIGVGTYSLLTSIATRKKTRQIEDLIIDRVLEIPEVKEHHEKVTHEKNDQPTNRVREAMTTERVKTPEHKAAIGV